MINRVTHNKFEGILLSTESLRDLNIHIGSFRSIVVKLSQHTPLIPRGIYNYHIKYECHSKTTWTPGCSFKQTHVFAAFYFFLTKPSINFNKKRTTQ